MFCANPNWANKWLNLRNQFKSLSYKIIRFSFLPGRDTIILSGWELQNSEPWQTRPRSINRLPPTVLNYSYKTIFLPGLLHWYPLVQTKSLLLHFISFLAWWFLDNDNNRRTCTFFSLFKSQCCDLSHRRHLDPELHHRLRPDLHQHLHHQEVHRDPGPLQMRLCRQWMVSYGAKRFNLMHLMRQSQTSKNDNIFSWCWLIGHKATWRTLHENLH